MEAGLNRFRFLSQLAFLAMKIDSQSTDSQASRLLALYFANTKTSPLLWQSRARRRPFGTQQAMLPQILGKDPLSLSSDAFLFIIPAAVD